MTDLIMSAAVGGSALAAIPAAIGVTTLWHRLVDFLDSHTDRPSTGPIGRPTRLALPAAPEPRQPIAAITARPHIEEACPLDACPLDLGPLEPAAFFDADRYALIGGH